MTEHAALELGNAASTTIRALLQSAETCLGLYVSQDPSQLLERLVKSCLLQAKGNVNFTVVSPALNKPATPWVVRANGTLCVCEYLQLYNRYPSGCHGHVWDRSTADPTLSVVSPALNKPATP